MPENRRINISIAHTESRSGPSIRYSQAVERETISETPGHNKDAEKNEKSHIYFPVVDVIRIVAFHKNVISRAREYRMINLCRLILFSLSLIPLALSIEQKIQRTYLKKRQAC